MTKDGPSSTRMGFGFRQAREAGAPYQAARSNAKIYLENLLKRRPELSGRVEALKAEGKRTDAILTILRDGSGDTVLN